MLGQCLLIGTGISFISTGLYAAITEDKYDQTDRKNEYIKIFTIIVIISTVLMFIFNRSESLVSSPNFEGVNPINYTKPPF
jgi:riboflavin transporter FmnP|tara:strand:- start:520 stop:762 length:243 start_codon:yes stop_codon:yes gene_type:complete